MSQSNTIHLGDHESDCEICKMNCGCDVCCRCIVCQVLIDFDGDGGHIYPDGSVTCSLCEGLDNDDSDIYTIREDNDEEV
jgi:hypothetical protein